METGRSFPTRKTGNSCLLPQVSGCSARQYFPSLFYLLNGGFKKKKHQASNVIALCSVSILENCTT